MNKSALLVLILIGVSTPVRAAYFECGTFRYDERGIPRQLKETTLIPNIDINDDSRFSFGCVVKSHKKEKVSYIITPLGKNKLHGSSEIIVTDDYYVSPATFQKALFTIDDKDDGYGGEFNRLEIIVNDTFAKDIIFFIEDDVGQIERYKAEHTQTKEIESIKSVTPPVVENKEKPVISTVNTNSFDKKSLKKACYNPLAPSFIIYREIDNVPQRALIKKNTERLKTYQQNLKIYRNCLASFFKNNDNNELQTKFYNLSIESERKAVENFNYKVLNKKPAIAKSKVIKKKFGESCDAGRTTKNAAVKGIESCAKSYRVIVGAHHELTATQDYDDLTMDYYDQIKVTLKNKNSYPVSVDLILYEWMSSKWWKDNVYAKDVPKPLSSTPCTGRLRMKRTIEANSEIKYQVPHTECYVRGFVKEYEKEVKRFRWYFEDGWLHVSDGRYQKFSTTAINIESVNEISAKKVNKSSDLTLNGNWLSDGESGCALIVHELYGRNWMYESLIDYDNDSVSFTGGCFDGKASGYGVATIYKKGRKFLIFSGNWTRGLMNGEFSIQYFRGFKFDTSRAKSTGKYVHGLPDTSFPIEIDYYDGDRYNGGVSEDGRITGKTEFKKKEELRKKLSRQTPSRNSNSTNIVIESKSSNSISTEYYLKCTGQSQGNGTVVNLYKGKYYANGWVMGSGPYDNFDTASKIACGEY